MFVSHEKNVVKKTFQKPNILRRKLKAVSRSNISNHSIANVSSATKSLVTKIHHVDNFSLTHSQYKQENKGQEVPTTLSDLKFKIESNFEKDVNKSQESDINVNINNNCTTLYDNINGNENLDKKYEDSLLNVESFINVSAPEQGLLLTKVDSNISPERKSSKIKWAIDLSTSSIVDVVSDFTVSQPVKFEKNESSTIVSTVSAVPNHHNQSNQSLEIICTPTPTRTVSVEIFSNRAVKFKCDEPNCDKGFWSAEKLRKHKNSHNKHSVRPQGQIIIECPVKKVISDGIEEKCPRTFQVRRDLLKHLDEDHTPEDALHKCEVCGRRFFWASGLRAHGQSLCARGGLACAWPGCARVFRLPCRLREHARAHTGDRPYMCHYPDCGWSFRSASKLVRHARRHTGERRHACEECGRAFLRPEHLRDHARRYHHRTACTSQLHRCTHAGCEQSFANVSSLYMHKKKVHRNIENENQVAMTSTTNQLSNSGETSENICLEDVSSVSGEWHAARTHCTWPLPSRHHQQDLTLVLEDNMPLDTTEGASSNVYTVRSDLFLHGNVLVDDDSQNIVGSEIAEGADVNTPLDSDLCLIDSHPTVDLMQEELMYEDAAVDESSFRVFLMNGEELA